MDKFFRNYKTDVSYYGLLIKENGKTRIAFWIMKHFVYLYIALEIFFLFLFSSRGIGRYISIVSMVSIVFFLVLLVILVLYFNSEMKKMIFKRYGLSTNEFMWNSADARRYIECEQLKIIYEYIAQENMTIKEIQDLHKEAKIELERSKPKFPIIPSICAGLLAIYVEKFTGKFIDLMKINDLKTLAFIMGLVAVTYLGILVVIIFGDKMLKFIVLEIYADRYEDFKSINRLLSKIDSSIFKQRFTFFE